MSRTTDPSGNLFSYKNFVHAFAGSVANAFSMTLLYPFETVRTRLQVDDRHEVNLTFFVIRDIVRYEGFWSLYRGWWSLIISNYVTNFAYFYAFTFLRLFVLSFDGAFSISSDLTSGIFAGFVAVLVSNPLWVINTRLKLQGIKPLARSLPGTSVTRSVLPHYSGIFDCLRHIVTHEGVGTLWGGLLTSLILCTNPAISFMIYEALKRNVMDVLRQWANASTLYFVFGALSKLFATIVTYPLQLIQTRARAGVAIPNLIHVPIWYCICIMYRGMESKLIQTVLTSALTLMTYELIVDAVFTLLRGGDSSSLEVA
jgi:adenine nucleotide transporter 17